MMPRKRAEVSLIVHPSDQRFGVAVERAQRGAQLMREIGNEVGAQRLVRLELRDVVEDEHPRGAARGANLRGAGADMQRRRILDHELRAHHATVRGLHRAPRELLQPRVAAKLDERPIAIVGFRSQSEDAPGRAVEQNHLAAGAGHHHRLGHAAQDGLELVALLGQRVDVGDDRVSGVEQVMLRAAHGIAAVRQQMRGRTPFLQRSGNRVESLCAARQRAGDSA